MGFDTVFHGSVTVTPALNEREIDYLTLFARTCRIERAKGPYFAVDDGDFGQRSAPDIRNRFAPPAGQPNQWCQWIPTEDGTAISWDGTEKFYDAPQWMLYLIETFLRPNATLQHELASPVPGRVYPSALHAFTFDHTVNGVVEARGGEHWSLSVDDNVVYLRRGEGPARRLLPGACTVAAEWVPAGATAPGKPASSWEPATSGEGARWA